MVNGTENSLIVTGGLNYERKKSYSVYIRCHDSGNPPLSVGNVVQIYVTDVNEPPYDITLSNNEVAENAGIVTVGRLDTADPDNEQTDVQTFSYSIVDPSGSVPFVIANDALNTTGGLDYEARTTWSLVIKSVDSKGKFVSQKVTFPKLRPGKMSWAYGMKLRLRNVGFSGRRHSTLMGVAVAALEKER